jgi:hypothetical protein
MNTKELVTKLSLLHPPEVIYEITTENVISEIVRRMGDEAISLTQNDIQLAIDEVKIAVDMYLDPREYISMGLDAFEVVRGLHS